MELLGNTTHCQQHNSFWLIFQTFWLIPLHDSCIILCNELLLLLTDPERQMSNSIIRLSKLIVLCAIWKGCVINDNLCRTLLLIMIIIEGCKMLSECDIYYLSTHIGSNFINLSLMANVISPIFGQDLYLVTSNNMC